MNKQADVSLHNACCSFFCGAFCIDFLLMVCMKNSLISVTFKSGGRETLKVKGVSQSESW